MAVIELKIISFLDLGKREPMSHILQYKKTELEYQHYVLN